MKTYKQTRFWFIYDMVFLLWSIGWFTRDMVVGNYLAAALQFALGILFIWLAKIHYKQMNEAKLKGAELEQKINEWVKEYNDGRK